MAVIDDLREAAGGNGHPLHLAAGLYRRGRLVTIGVNGRNGKPFRRWYVNGEAFCSHAETAALLSARRGDHLDVARFTLDGQVRMAKPCRRCEKKIRRLGVLCRYTDNDGCWRIL